MFKPILTSLSLILFQFSAQSQACQFQILPTSTSACLGDTVCIGSTGGVTGAVIEEFDFNSSSVPTGWNIVGGSSFGQLCAPSLTGTDYYWSSTAGTSTPTVVTNLMDVSAGGAIQFDLVFAVQAGLAPCEGPDLWDEGVFLQYSNDNGSTWVDIVYFNPLGTFSITPGGIASGQTAFTSWGTYCFPIPPGAQTTSTMFRWQQPNSSGTNFDNWGLDNVSVANILPGTSVNWSNGTSSSASLCLPVTSDTTITAFLINSLGDTLAQDQITVTMNSAYNVLDTIMVCANDDVTFADGTVLTNITSPTTHTSSFQTVNGCDSTITTAALINETYSILDTILVCENDDVTFADGTVFTNITSPMSHTSSLQTVNGCDSTITTAATVIFTDASATQTDSTITASNTGSGVTYFWIDCDNNFVELSGETGQTFSPTQSGVYAVVVTQNGCSDTSSCFTIDTTASINKVDLLEVKVYPNPFVDHFTIDLGSIQDNVNVNVVDGLGRAVFTRVYENTDSINIDLEGNAGLYFVELSVGGKQLIVAMSKE